MQEICLSEKDRKNLDRYIRILSQMRQLRLDQYVLADKIGVSQPMVCFLINGKKRSIEREKKICEILNLDWNDLWGKSA